MIVLRGYGSQSYLDDVAVLIASDPRPTTLVYAGDFDPSGEDIVRDFRERVYGINEFVKVAVSRRPSSGSTSPSSPARRLTRARRVPGRHGGGSYRSRSRRSRRRTCATCSGPRSTRLWNVCVGGRDRRRGTPSGVPAVSVETRRRRRPDPLRRAVAPRRPLITRSFDRKADAVVFERERRRAALGAHGLPDPPSPMPLAEWLDRWWGASRPRWAPSTRRPMPSRSTDGFPAPAGCGCVTSATRGSGSGGRTFSRTGARRPGKQGGPGVLVGARRGRRGGVLPSNPVPGYGPCR